MIASRHFRVQFFKCLVIISFISNLFLSCTIFNTTGWDDLVNKRSRTLTDLASPLLEDEYTVLVVTDVHFGESKDRICDEKFFAWLKDLQSSSSPDFPKFVLCLGDVAQHGRTEQFDLYNDFCKKIKKDFSLKTYTVVGNHDLYANKWSYFKEIIHPHTSFFRFQTKSFSWYFLDTGNLTLGNNQFDALKKAFQSDSRPKIVLTHCPLYAGGGFYASEQDTIERNMTISLFNKNNVKYFFAGHTHRYSKNDIGYTEYVIPGFLEKNEWAILKINENSQKISVTICP